MFEEKILTNRLVNQGISNNKFTTVSDTVKYFGAIQAQDYNAVKWALGLRIKNMNEIQIEKAINDENIIRTHVLRPTWHLVHKDDIRWMLNLTAPRIRQVNSTQFKKVNLTENILKISYEIIRESLTGDLELTQDELGKKILETNSSVKKNQVQMILMNAELDQLICNGKTKENRFTYTLFDEKVPKCKEPPSEQVIEELARRYFTSHGPATAQDFARWSGLTVADTKKAIQSLKETGKSELQEEQGIYFFNELIEENLGNCNFLLPRYDEYFNGYKEKTMFLKKYSVSWEPLGQNVLISKGQIIGNWTRIVTKDEVKIRFKFLYKMNYIKKDFLKEISKDYADFLNKKSVIINNV